MPAFFNSGRRTIASWIVLLRGINVGGANKLSMKDLRELLEMARFRDVQTYIQSGNCVLSADADDPAAISQTVSGAIEAARGFRPKAIAIKPDYLETALAENPFPDDNPKAVHIFFMNEEPSSADVDGMRALAQPEEDFKLNGRVLYLYTPNGFGRSKLAEKLDRHIKAEKTGRNLNSVREIAALARQADST
jgi:uncharacterized protein (DUF1697 family)